MNKPHPRILAIWRINLVLISFIPAFLTSVLFRVASFAWITATCIWIIVFFGVFLIYLPLFYKSVSYGVKGDKIVLNAGVLYNRLTSIPINEIQFVTVTQTIFGRIFGLFSVIVTAAGGRIVISGLKPDNVSFLLSFYDK